MDVGCFGRGKNMFAWYCRNHGARNPRVRRITLNIWSTSIEGSCLWQWESRRKERQAANGLTVDIPIVDCESS